MALHMTYEQKQMVRRLHAKGLTIRAIAKEIGYTPNVVHLTTTGTQVKPGRPDEWTPRPDRLRADEREDIWIGLARGKSMSAIARTLGRSPSTITREVAKNGGAEHYGPWRAHYRASKAVRRFTTPETESRTAKSAGHEMAREFWSPPRRSRRACAWSCPDDSMMWVSHETIYRCALR